MQVWIDVFKQSTLLLLWTQCMLSMNSWSIKNDFTIVETGMTVDSEHQGVIAKLHFLNQRPRQTEYTNLLWMNSSLMSVPALHVRTWTLASSYVKEWWSLCVLGDQHQYFECCAVVCVAIVIHPETSEETESVFKSEVIFSGAWEAMIIISVLHAYSS